MIFCFPKILFLQIQCSTMTGGTDVCNFADPFSNFLQGSSFPFSPGFLCNLVRKSPQNVEKICRFPGVTSLAVMAFSIPIPSASKWMYTWLTTVTREEIHRKLQNLEIGVERDSTNQRWAKLYESSKDGDERCEQLSLNLLTLEPARARL